MPQDQQAIQKSERDRWHHEQVHRGDAISMMRRNVFHPWDGGGPLLRAIYLATLVCPTSMPSLSSSPWIRGAPPERVGKAHVADQLTYLKRHGRPSAARPRLPAPVRSESHTVPTDHGVRFDNRQRRSNIGEQSTEAAEINRSVLLKAGLFGPVRRRTLICWRSTRFSASSADLERNRPTSAHQISLQTSLIAYRINRFALARYWVRFAVGTAMIERLSAPGRREGSVARKFRVGALCPT